MQSPAPFARIGTRGSPLALAQARLLRKLLSEKHGVSEDEIAIEVISTGGDRSQASNATLSDIGGKGLFTKEIDEAMLSGRVDIGVHSSKDVATRMPDGLRLAAFLEREDSLVILWNMFSSLHVSHSLVILWNMYRSRHKFLTH